MLDPTPLARLVSATILLIAVTWTTPKPPIYPLEPIAYHQAVGEVST
jgi:hypothetical protein